MVSPTILSNNTFNFKQNIDVHPFGKIYLTTIKLLFFLKLKLVKL